jgi:heme-binding protein
VKDRLVRTFRQRPVLSGLGVLVLAFAIIQLVPYRVHNPSASHEPPWDSPRTRRLAVVACFDCHSNRTNTYWWEDIAPVSWWITKHVNDGRARLNLSECTGRGGEGGDSAETIRNGSMPPNYYTWLGLHSNAKLTKQEKSNLASGLSRTLRGAGCGGGG